ncbi:hypothetical protein E3Q23_02706 [Wallemia mellicola]|uniref:t-SNARE n=1 Tax=Wallemia mellicola TaxID=1708541 RepID=A0A4T0TFT3_9BASI|nr:hypothetical protein E3Q23_02706 [Wallemia mellicola]TIC53487.1 t-SNARE [Wallemia mellicola]TIC64152.1 t-SNARE [Wallemia mellicola]
MTIKNRTFEWRAHLDSYNKINKRNLTNNFNLNNNHSRTEFSRLATTIAKDIESTTLKLQKLTQLAQRKSLFDDKQQEISELTYIIKQDINDLNSQIQHLQQYSNHQIKKSPLGEHQSNVVILLQNKLANTSIGFKDVLELRTQNIKKTKERTEKFTNLQTQQPEYVSDSPLYNSRPSSSQAHRRKQRNSDFLALDLDDAESGQSNGQPGAQQMSLVDRQSDYMNERSTAIDTIESTIGELGQIFSQLSSMVAMQGETVQRIDADVQDISDNVYGAQTELLKYYESIKSNRMLMFKVFGIIIIFFLVFILVT